MLLTWGAETLKLQIPAIVLALLLAIAFAAIAAMRQYSRLDFGVMTSALLGHSLPGFLLGVLLILIFAYWLGIFPSYGAYSTRNPLLGSTVIDALWHMVLPLTMLTVFNTATLTLLLRATWWMCCGRTSSWRRALPACPNGGSCSITHCAMRSSRC